MKGVCKDIGSAMRRLRVRRDNAGNLLRSYIGHEPPTLDSSFLLRISAQLHYLISVKL